MIRTLGDYECHDCLQNFDAPQDLEERMAYLCPYCKSHNWGIKRQRSVAVRGDLDDFSRENGGRGRWNPQINGYMRNVNDVKEHARKNGLQYTT